jgi:hypothetical protein
MHPERRRLARCADCDLLTMIIWPPVPLNDASGASADNPAGYTPMLWRLTFLRPFAFVFAFATLCTSSPALLRRDECCLSIRRRGGVPS